MKLRSGFPFNYDADVASFDSGVMIDPEEKKTRDSFIEECDINTIVKRFALTGALPENVRMPTYGDFEGVNDFQTAMNAIVAARESFDQMPAEVRLRFHNDPQEFVEFCSDESNREEALELGLVEPAAAPIPESIQKVQIVTPENEVKDAPGMGSVQR